MCVDRGHEVFILFTVIVISTTIVISIQKSVGVTDNKEVN